MSSMADPGTQDECDLDNRDAIKSYF